ncbi:hypothetical protein P775_03825 [Puniceibacterium antarcticum]|uniref:Anti-sigma K factor RskA C-terminal domain-containing protein n=1 Tax=Puniceibacterium antarcticum TaxID=1206336 RepID=A0A2G8RJ89_9RHOB|nr:anti-sigma factor [Puniceibacterium antarcticum]PIL21563.1 hypothetical protein P775_03825 [Puniceibacterium antarcticum]
MTSTSDTPEDGILAAEYVLRLLSPAEEAAFEARLTLETHLMDYVAFWASRLSGLNDEIAETTPPSRTRRQLMARLFGPIEPLSFWQRASLWQGLSFASIVLSGFLALQMLQIPEPTLPAGPKALLISEISAEDQSLRVLAIYKANTNHLEIARTAGQAAPGRVLELWAIAEGAAPVSLGVLPEGANTSVILPEGMSAQLASLTLAISDEPPGGSNTGAPTGAVLAVGQVSEL